MEDAVRAFHFENLRAALDCLVDFGDLHPEVSFIENGKPYLVDNPEVRDSLNPGRVAQAVLDQRNAEIVNFVCLARTDDKEVGEPANENSTAGKLLLIAVTFDRSGPQLTSVYEIVSIKEGVEITFRDATKGDGPLDLLLKS